MGLEDFSPDAKDDPETYKIKPKITTMFVGWAVYTPTHGASKQHRNGL